MLSILYSQKNGLAIFVGLKLAWFRTNHTTPRYPTQPLVPNPEPNVIVYTIYNHNAFTSHTQGKYIGIDLLTAFLQTTATSCTQQLTLNNGTISSTIRNGSTNVCCTS